MVTQSAPWGGLLACLNIASGRPTSIFFTALKLHLTMLFHSGHTLATNGLGIWLVGDFKALSYQFTIYVE